METNEEIEMMLWEYMDGSCTMADMQRISILVERDEVWKQKYKELHALHTGIANNMQLEQPSLRFTKNVMEAVAAVHIAPATKKYINKGIIRGIAAFFIITITAFLGYAIATANWGVDGTSFTSKFNLNRFNPSSLFNSSAFTVIIAINVALGLILLDSFLRRKKVNHN